MTPDYESLIASAETVVTSKRRCYAECDVIRARQVSMGISVTIPKVLAGKLDFSLRQRFALIELPNGTWVLVPHKHGVMLSDTGGVQLIVRFASLNLHESVEDITLVAQLHDGLVTFPANSFQLINPEA